MVESPVTGAILLPTGPITGRFTIRLSSAPTRSVWITLHSAYFTGTPFGEISIDGGLTWGTSAVLEIVAGDTDEHVVLLRTFATSFLDPIDPVQTVLMTARSLDPVFQRAAVASVYINLPLTAEGTLPPPVTVPTDQGLGDRDLTAHDRNGPNRSVRAGSGALAYTGADPTAPVGVAIIALLLGLALLVVAGRRRRAVR